MHSAGSQSPVVALHTVSQGGASATAPAPARAAAPAADGFAGHFKRHGLWAPGVLLFRQMPFSSKALVISAAFVLPMVDLLLWALHTLGGDARQARVDATRQHVEVAHGVLEWAHAQEQSGAMTREQAQGVAKQAVQRLRYDGQEYFWINDLSPRMVMHPFKPEMEGQLLNDFKDPTGFALFSAAVKIVQTQGAGELAYQWPRPGSDTPVDKVSYVKGFEPWGWVVGSGVYVEDLQQAQRRRIAVFVVVVTGALLIAGYLFLCFARVMSGGLTAVARHLQAITRGDLTTSPQSYGSDEYAHLMGELRTMQEALRHMVREVRQSSVGIVQASREVAAGAMDLSTRTEQTASSLQATAMSVETMAATVVATAGHTEEAAGVARRNAEVAAEGGRVMHDVVTTMDDIRGASTRIADIIGTVEAIAFQTNILALNAAVEAARAGAQGRGFAVVAAEVRTLAHRSSEAAHEIKALIDSSVAQVQLGADVVRRAGATIEQIVDTSQRVDRLLGEVAEGARAQSVGMGSIGRTVQELDRATQQNAAMVEQSAAAAAAMESQAQALGREVARFQLP